MCKYCDIAQGKENSALLYQDDQVVAFLAEKPATIGHIVVAPKEHLPIFEALSDDLAEHMSAIANKISVAVFEAIKCEGTNIIVHNGVEAGQEDPHFSLNVIARKTGDGLNFEWSPQQVGEEEMSMIELQLKEELGKEDVMAEVPEQAEKESAAAEEGAPAEEGADEKEKAPEKVTEENYMIKQLKRMP